MPLLFDVRKTVEGLNNLQIIDTIKSELLCQGEKQQREGNQITSEMTIQDQKESKPRYFLKQPKYDVEQSLIKRVAHERLNPVKIRFLKNLIDSNIFSKVELSSKFYISKGWLYSIRGTRMCNINRRIDQNKYNYKLFDMDFIKSEVDKLVKITKTPISIKDVQSSLLIEHHISIPVWKLMKIMKEKLHLSFK